MGLQSFSISHRHNYKGCIPNLLCGCHFCWVLPPFCCGYHSSCRVLIEMEFLSLALSLCCFLVSWQPNITLIEPIKINMWIRCSASFIFRWILVSLRLTYAFVILYWSECFFGPHVYWRVDMRISMLAGHSWKIFKSFKCVTSEHWTLHFAFEQSSPFPLQWYTLSVTDSTI